MRLQRINCRYGRSDRWIGYWWEPNYWSGQLKYLTLYLLRRQFTIIFDFRKGNLGDWLRRSADEK
jgi:hypothetical protein